MCHDPYDDVLLRCLNAADLDAEQHASRRTAKADHHEDLIADFRDLVQQAAIRAQIADLWEGGK